MEMHSLASWRVVLLAVLSHDVALRKPGHLRRQHRQVRNATGGGQVGPSDELRRNTAPFEVTTTPRHRLGVLQ